MRTVDILKTRLEAINTDCEAEIQLEITKLYNEARYDGTKFRVPSFHIAGSLWLEGIAKKERAFIGEVARVLKTPGALLPQSEANEVYSFIEKIFSEDKYIDRLSQFSEGVARKATSFGLAFDPQAQGVDLRVTAFRAGAMNALRRAKANIVAEIELNSFSRTPELVRTLSQWLLFLRTNPLRSISVFVLMVFVPWVISKTSMADALYCLRTLRLYLE